MISLIVWGVILVVVLGFIAACFVTVEQQEVVMVQQFGKFSRVLHAGLNLKMPLIETVSYPLSLKVQQLNVEVETKTKDNVFVKMNVAVQFAIKPEKAYEAFYKLTNTGEQITAYVFDVVRSKVPQIELDKVFEAKEDIAVAVKTELQQTMDDFGLDIIKALVTDIDPDKKVKDSMNEINAASRMREAAIQKGEGEKILRVKQAEAEAESKKLQGEGIANERKAIINGLQESVKAFEDSTGIQANDAMTLVLLTQYFDTLKAMGASGGTTILLPHSPSAVADLSDQIRNAILVGNSVKK